MISPVHSSTCVPDASPSRLEMENTKKPSILLPVLIVLAAALVLYGGVLQKLVHDWIDDPNYSHGFFIPLFVGFVLWTKRKRLLSLSHEGTWWGVLAGLAALCLMIVATLGAELFLARVSFVLLLAGVILCFGGWRSDGHRHPKWGYRYG